ncbi:FadR/GntR family transcriptional regulator [Rothia terrae]|uniref:FadR/GntR family transcriptional regulator n=1 Tax=Rothia terrae TaxID=396015 RepID=UPI0033F0B53C
MAVHSTILEWLEKELFEGRLQLGQDLPDDKEIAEAVGATHSSTREALKHLEDMGVVRLYEGRKKTIITQLVKEPAASAGPALRLHMANAKYPVRDMVQTRLVVEGWALQNADPQHPAMQELAGLQKEMSRENISLKEFHDLEVSFHIALVKIGGNELLTGLMTALREPLFEYMMSLVGRGGLWSTTAARTRAQHKAIVDAIASGDNALASMLVTAHIREQYEEAGLDLDAPRIPDTEHEPALEMTPVEDEDQDLIPENPDFEPSADLLNALNSIAPTAPARSAYRPQTAAAQQVGSQNTPEKVTVPHHESVVHSARLTNDSREAYAKVEGRRRRSGTVSVPVHATVIKPVNRSTPTGVISGQVRPRTEDARAEDTAAPASAKPSWAHTADHDTVRATPRPAQQNEDAAQPAPERVEETETQHNGIAASLRDKARLSWRRKSRSEQVEQGTQQVEDSDAVAADIEQPVESEAYHATVTKVQVPAEDSQKDAQQLNDGTATSDEGIASAEERTSHGAGRIKQFFGWGASSSKRDKEPERVALKNTAVASAQYVAEGEGSADGDEPTAEVNSATLSESAEAPVQSNQDAGDLVQERETETALEDAEQAHALTADETESDAANPLAGAGNVVVKSKSKKKKRKRR